MLLSVAMTMLFVIFLQRILCNKKRNVEPEGFHISFDEGAVKNAREADPSVHELPTI